MNVPRVAEVPSEARDLGEARQAKVSNTVLCAVSNKGFLCKLLLQGLGHVSWLLSPLQGCIGIDGCLDDVDSVIQ